MSKKIWIWMIAGALAMGCKPTPRTANRHDTPPPPPADEAAQAAETSATEEKAARPAVGQLEITTTRQEYNRLRPWEKNEVNTGRTMGIYLGNGRVLAPGNAARAATYVELRLPNGSRIAPARVVKYDHDLNLALLTVEHPEDADIFEGMPALSVGEPLALGYRAEVCAPVREQEQTLVEVEVENSTDEEDNASDLPRLDLRAAKPLPQGNAVGLPVLRDGKLVAMVETYSPRELTLTCINAEFITRFLDESTPAGASVPILGISCSLLDDPVFTKYLKLSPQQGGVYVNKVQYGSAAAAAGLQEGDVITAIDGLKLDKLGRCKHPLYGMLSAPLTLRSLKPVGQHITLSVSRNGEQHEVPVALNRDVLSKSLLRPEKPGDAPRYIVWGGMVFQPLSGTYLNALAASAGSLPLPLLQVTDRAEELQKNGLQEVVALTLVIPTPATLGYDTLGFCMVERVNGQQVTSFAQFAELLDTPTEDGIVELAINRSPYKIYLERSTVEATNDTIRRRAISRLRRMGQEQPGAHARPNQ